MGRQGPAMTTTGYVHGYAPAVQAFLAGQNPGATVAATTQAPGSVGGGAACS